jgi:hypothetical protein
VDGDTSDEEAALSSDAYFLVRRDDRQCMPPPCGGFFVRELNRPTPATQISEPRMSVADPSLAPFVFEAPRDELIVRGHWARREPRIAPQFVVTEVYRGMPGATVTDEEQYFAVTPGDCTANDCLPAAARPVNATGATLVGSLSVTQAVENGGDPQWLRARILAHGAIVAGSLSGNSLDASQVFVRLPDHVGPCASATSVSCDAGRVPIYQRDVKRCLVFAGCSAPGSCLMYLPVCASGYTLHSWSSGSPACPTYACDPDFLSTD